MKKVLFVAIMLLGTLSVSAKNVVKITTSCDKVAYIDTERGSMSQVIACGQLAYKKEGKEC